MISIYKRQKLYQFLLIFGLSTFIVAMDLNSENVLWGTLIGLIIGQFLYDIFYKELLLNIDINKETITIDYYTIVFKKEQYVMKLEELIDLKSKNPSSLVFIISGENGSIKKTYYNNTPPWGNLNSKLSELKKTIANN